MINIKIDTEFYNEVTQNKFVMLLLFLNVVCFGKRLILTFFLKTPSSFASISGTWKI
jgi:hypothetical protein